MKRRGKRVDREATYRAQEFAAKAGVTVRALHHYDRLGLLKPARASNRYRIYRERDFVRLGQIVTLKFIGFPLKQIGGLLGRGALELRSALRLQREIMQEKRRHLDKAVRALRFAEQVADSGGGEVAGALRKIIEVIEMTNNMDWVMQYYSPEARAAMEKRNRENPGLAEQGTRDWMALIAEVEQAVRDGVDPAGARAQKLAQRWQELIASFTGGNPEVAAGLSKLYSDKTNWPADFKPCSTDVTSFIAKAGAARRK
jgi:DNA-binding transcriptional MerR regulator